MACREPDKHLFQKLVGKVTKLSTMTFVYHATVLVIQDYHVFSQTKIK
jgi:hypothetical protein